ncbi:hypothetical protein [Calothrix sp. NIES-3974]|uniref:hypothetical protein n=1 Tax=Calothrix sp. NIES-3974 TaxID=2005462 RepID=UPI000B621096|nr:hypothetical protein [Calothrix sp. NIES-3974]BAZ05726.1 hypothetical protein NIES3974_23800 [Calothrix sp. NIES-3974]
MFKKSFAIGILAAMAIAPAALADQVQGNQSSTQITTGNNGVGNVNGVVSNTNSGQYQDKYNNPFCASGNQVQGNVAGTGIAAGNIGFGNVSGVNANTSNGQTQVASCAFPF